MWLGEMDNQPYKPYIFPGLRSRRVQASYEDACVFRSATSSHAPLVRRMQLVIVIGDFHGHAVQARLITYH